MHLVSNFYDFPLKSCFFGQLEPAAGQLRPLRHHIYRGAVVGLRGAVVGVRGAAVGIRGAAVGNIGIPTYA